MLTLITVVISGLFAILASLITWRLSGAREKIQLRTNAKLHDLRAAEALYTSFLATVDKSIMTTRSAQSYTILFDELATNTAKINLIASEDLKEKIEIVCNNLHHWSSLYKKGTPKQIGDTGFAMVSNKHLESLEKSNLVYKDLRESIADLVFAIKDELKELKSQALK